MIRIRKLPGRGLVFGIIISFDEFTGISIGFGAYHLDIGRKREVGHGKG